MGKADFIDKILALVLVICVIGLIFAARIGLLSDSLETIKYIAIGVFSVFTGKQIPTSIGK